MGPIHSASDGGLEAPSQAHAAPALDEHPDVAALRACGAHRLDPPRFRYIEALARQAVVCHGALRRLLEQQLVHKLAAYRVQYDKARTESDLALPALLQRHPQACDALRELHADGNYRALRRLRLRLEGLPVRGPLGDLVSQYAQQAMQPAAGVGSGPDAGASAHAEPLAELKTVRDFRNTWAGLRVDQQLTRSQQQVPENPGPLNSQLLVLRSLRRMQEIAPAYLERFMVHVDTLLWLDQAHVRTASAPGKVARPVPGRKKSMPALKRPR